jgi:hypothetical protein
LFLHFLSLPNFSLLFSSCSYLPHPKLLP